ncbi:CHAT domain-containing protein [Streptomyces sp. HC307]|uniref:CHAT domain-containing protein n=1 Tax=Streptomyces flavusporus TaxID=3385496 RepID=UPI003916E2B2
MTSTLTILDDFHGEYEDNVLYRRAQNRHVSGRLGGSPLMRETLLLLNRWVGSYDMCRRPEFTLLGQYLYIVAFGDTQPFDSGQAPVPAALPPLRRAFEESYEWHLQQQLRDDFRLRLVVRREARELGSYPWEFLFMPRPSGGFFLAEEDSRLVLSRYVPNTDFTQDTEVRLGSPEGHDEGLRILVVLSRPRAPELAEPKADELVRAVENLAENSDVDVDVIESPTRGQLRRSIVEKPTHIIHFIGHGRAGAIALKKDDQQLREDRAKWQLQRSRDDTVFEVDEADWADNRSVCTLLRSGLAGDPDYVRAHPRGRLIFLHACHGASAHGREDSLQSFSSIARDLADGERVAAVVAMQYAIEMGHAQQFAMDFYSRIRSGKRMDDAVSWARRELGLTPVPGRQVWDHRCFGTPVIYVRQEAPFFQPPRRVAVSAKTQCPNTRCQGLVIRDRPPCRECNSQFRRCPKPDCEGVLMLAPGSACTDCDYLVEPREDPGSGEGPSGGQGPRPGPSGGTGFDGGGPRTGPSLPGDGRGAAERGRTSGARDIGYGDQLSGGSGPPDRGD